jgi:hypothetical protein
MRSAYTSPPQLHVAQRPGQTRRLGQYVDEGQRGPVESPGTAVIIKAYSLSLASFHSSPHSWQATVPRSAAQIEYDKFDCI